MAIRILLAALTLIFLVGAPALAADLPAYTRGGSVLHGGSVSAGKASGDTVLVMGPTGSGALHLGDFEAGWNGWTTVDNTQPLENHWQVSNYNQAVATNLAAWSGDLTIPSCNDSLDVVGGYGNSWHDLLAYRQTVANPGAATTVMVTATMQHDVEPGYDYVRLSAKIEGSLTFVDLQAWDGKGTVAINNSVSYLPNELIDGTDVYLLFRVQSDGGWSDEDCSWPTAGACQVDDITVTCVQDGQADLVSYTDFQDGTFGAWFQDLPNGVGDFGQLWSGLRALDPCAANGSQQAAFIDDGVVVPGTGGSNCINWCYGPQGYIVNTMGGLQGPSGRISSDIISPSMAWPAATYDGIIFSFDVYRHEDLSADAPGIFYTWGIRSADIDDSAGNGAQVLEDQAYQDYNFIYYGGPDFLRPSNDVTGLMNPGRDEVQVRLGVLELGWAWGWIGNDGYPAPYFDNISVKVFPHIGPAMTARELDLAQDNFPEVDAINLLDLGSMHVRFDMAKNIALSAHMLNQPGDSIIVDIAPTREGSRRYGDYLIRYTIDANPVFDPYRTEPTTGERIGRWAVSEKRIPEGTTWSFDLPDTGLMFPGDVLHYYILAADEVAGDVQYATIPADTVGYSNFSDPWLYDRSFTVRALPSINSDGFGGFEVPPVLFWNDFANRGNEAEWYGALANHGLEPGFDYDIYYTNAPSSGVGNGLGGRTSGLALEYYNTLLYTSGDLGVNTLSNGDFTNDPGDDIGALVNWMSGGNRNLFLTGDNLASDLGINAGAAGLSFLESIMGLNVSTTDIRSFIDNQTAPLVLAVAGNPVFQTVDSWIAYGGCSQINTFDGVTTRAGAARLAEFGDANGNPGAYGFSAATLNAYNTTNRVVTLPYGLAYVYTDPNAKSLGPLPGRAMILRDVLNFFGIWDRYPGDSPDVPRAEFAVTNYPNPFNPSTRISYTIKNAGHLTLKIYNLRGQLVRTLIDGPVQTDGFVMWNGNDEAGSQVASGVYFYEARLGPDVQISKLTLVK